MQTVKELKALAKKRDIIGYYRLRKAKFIEILMCRKYRRIH